MKVPKRYNYFMKGVVQNVTGSIDTIQVNRFIHVG